MAARQSVFGTIGDDLRRGMTHASTKRFSLANAGTLMVSDFKKGLSTVAATNKMDMLFYLVICGWVVVSSNAYGYFGKRLYGRRSLPGAPSEIEVDGVTIVLPDAPSICASIGISLLACSAVYFLINLSIYQGKLGLLLQNMFAPKYWFACLPYAAGHAVTYYLYLESLRHISAASAAAFTQARLGLDVVIAYIVLSKPLSACKVAMVVTILVSVATHFSVLEENEKNKSPEEGQNILILYTITMAFTYSYFPWALPKFQLPASLCLLISSLQIAAFGIIGHLATEERGLFDGIQHDDLGFYLSWIAVDAALFLCPIWIQPVFFTLLITLQIPCLHILEDNFFGTEFSSLIFVSSMAILFIVVGFAAYEYERELYLASQDED